NTADVWYVGAMPRVSSLSRRNRHQSRAQNAVRNGVALLQDHDDAAGFLLGRHRRYGLMEMGVELVARSRCDFTHLIALKCRIQLAQCGFDAFLPGFRGL